MEEGKKRLKGAAVLCASRSPVSCWCTHQCAGSVQHLLASHHTHTHFSAHPQVISHLYELYGEEVASMLDGFFAFVILDKRTNTFYAARDPIGITCMYIGWGKDGSVWLSSEMKCLKVWESVGEVWEPVQFVGQGRFNVFVVPLPHPAGFSQDDSTHSQQCPCFSGPLAVANPSCVVPLWLSLQDDCTHP